MVRHLYALRFLCVSVGLALAHGASAQVIRVGAEFQVNSYTPDAQQSPAVATDGDGDFVIAWHAAGLDGGGNGVFARHFSNTGTGLASEFQVNTYTPGNQAFAAVAAASGGAFVVVWNSSAQDGSATGLFARPFSSAGTPLASELQVNSFTTYGQYGPSMAADADGDFVVAWSSNLQDSSAYGVFARRFSSAGVAIALEFQVTTHTTNDQRRPSVASAPGGDFVIAWQSSLQDGDNIGIFARRFSGTGTPLAAEFQVNAYTTGYQGDATLAMDTDGDFVVAWSSYHDGSFTGIFARRYSSAGTPLGGEFQVNTYTPSYQIGPWLAAESDGDFFVAWFSTGQDGNDNGIFARRFSSAGEALATEFQINAYTTGNQRSPVVALRGGRFVVSWASAGQDGNSYGIFGQRLIAAIALDVDGNGAVNALTDTLLALRYAFGFRGATLITGAVDQVGCTRCTAPAIEAHLAGLTN